MCGSAPKVKPTASPPIASPVVVDEAALAERDRQRAAARNRAGRQSTILAGLMNEGRGGPTVPTASVKTSTGS